MLARFQIQPSDRTHRTHSLHCAALPLLQHSPPMSSRTGTRRGGKGNFMMATASLTTTMMAFSLISFTHAFSIAQRHATTRNSFLASHGSQSLLVEESQRRRRSTRCFLQYNDFEELEEDEEEDDDTIDPDSLGDWRAFRRNLAGTQKLLEDGDDEESPISTVSTPRRRQVSSKENEEVLRSQNKELAEEYSSGVWAHETSTPEVGGLLCRMPLEVEIYRNFRHSMIGKRLRKKLTSSSIHTSDWYREAQTLVTEEMQDIADNAEGGQIDATVLGEEAAEMLQLYIDNQETWQEVCLVLDRDETLGTATTVVLNRPMAMKLTENLAQLVRYGAYVAKDVEARRSSHTELRRFVKAFGAECAVYVGGPDKQDDPATMIHGFSDLPGATELSFGSGVYKGGLDAAIEGVLSGKYSPLDFRFFVGRHQYKESQLDVEVVLGKYQPIACARTLALKQCISLPQPLWHEILELCGGELGEISSLEMLKRDDMLFEIVDEDDDDEIPDELGELGQLDDEDDDDFYA